MSLGILYYKDSKGNIILVDFDPAEDSAELGDKIKATIASREESNITPTEGTFPSIQNPSTSTTLAGASAERIGVAPEHRSNTQIPSLSDVASIRKQEKQRSLVKDWLSSDADQSDSTASQGSQRHSTVTEDAFSVLDCEPERIELAKKFRSTRAADGENQRSEYAASGTPLLTPAKISPTTNDGAVRSITDLEPIHSAYEMAHDAEELAADQSPERQLPKRQESTSMANAVAYQRKFAEYDTKSITATVGSKKTVESIYDGTSVKDLSLEESLEEYKGRERSPTITDKLRSVFPRRSNSKLNNKKKDPCSTDSPTEEKLAESSHKRGLSTTSLMPPENDSTSDYTYNTSADANGYLAANARTSSEAPDPSGSTSPLTRLRRSFSKGEKRKSFTESGSTPHIVGLMRREGGPPVSTALVSPLHEHSGFEESAVEPIADEEKEDDDDDEYEGDSDSNDEAKAKGGYEELSIETIAITPDLDGFKEHALRLNPDMASFLADRIALEQVRRFKELKGHKIRHVQDVQLQKCGSARYCSALGGEPIYLPARSNNKGEKTQIFFMKGHPEIDEPGVVATNFQYGIPEPPVRQLPATFECSLCFKERKAINKPSDWTKHVQEDLQPFTCTFRMCTTEKKSFKRKADWVRHENECHRHLEEWRCNFPECQHVCYRSDNFSQHLIREHKIPDFKNKTRGSVSSKIRAQPVSQYGQEEEQIVMLHKTCYAKNKADPATEPCVFCGTESPTWKKHQIHLGKHMEAIALPVLGLVAREEVSPDMTISPIKREPITPMMRSNTISDIMSGTDAHTLTPYSTNKSAVHHGSSEIQSPLSFPPRQQAETQFPSYLTDPRSRNAQLAASQSLRSASVFAPHHTSSRHTSSPMGGVPYEHLGYQSHQTGYLEPFHQHDESLQREGSPLYEGHQQHQSFTHVNLNVPSTYLPNMERSRAQVQLHPQMAFPVADQMPSHDFVNSPHSGAPYHHSTTPSPHQPHAFHVKYQLEIPRSGPMLRQMSVYPTDDYSNTYGYHDQQAAYASPLEADPYPTEFYTSVEAQKYSAVTSALASDAMTATSLPMDNTMYDAQHYGYAPQTLTPHSQTYDFP